MTIFTEDSDAFNPEVSYEMRWKTEDENSGTD
jgi:hypothetical protein